jgi:hypothetical protein
LRLGQENGLQDRNVRRLISREAASVSGRFDEVELQTTIG